jgi:putative endonuclease
MFYAYVIQSISDHNSFYKGHCENLEKRLEQHNSGLTKSIRNKTPFKIVYFEEFEELESALRREKYFKNATGRRFLKSKLI